MRRRSRSPGRRHASPLALPIARRSFGYQRLRVLATFVNGCALLFIVAWIAIEAVQRLLNPVAVNATAILWVGGLGLVVNLMVFAMLRRGDSHDMNIAAATLHVFGDLLGSVAAVRRRCRDSVHRLAADRSAAVVARVRADRAQRLGAGARSAHILMEGSPDWLDIERAAQHARAAHPRDSRRASRAHLAGRTARNAADDACVGDRGSKSRSRTEGSEGVARRALRHHPRDDSDRSRRVRGRGCSRSSGWRTSG